MRRWLLSALILAAMWGCQGNSVFQQEAQAFIDQYTEEYQKLYYESAKAEWTSNTYIVPGDTTVGAATRAANEALAAFTGRVETIDAARRFLAERNRMTDLQARQLDAILYYAGNNPQTVPELVKARIKAETAQVEALFGYTFSLEGKPISTSELDDLLRTETDQRRRLAAWQASKEVGRELRDGLARLRDLRNQTVQALGYDDYFAYQVSAYGMTSAEMMELNRRLVTEVTPLYRQLHTYARHELAARYGVGTVPELLPAHWLPNRWGQDWNAMISVEGFDLDGALREKPREWLMEQGERFYTSIGFDKLPQSYWEKSSLYPLPPDSDHKKNNHASAWHMNLEDDVRCLMSIVPNADMYETVHHELGHIYYYMAYTNPEVPPLLREGANRAYHEAVGSLLGLAAMQKPFLQHLDLVPPDAETDAMQTLLKEALNYIVFIPWSAGVMTEFEYELYANNLPSEEFNSKWWELKRKYQGIVPPVERGPDYCDAASKTHITNDAAQYYDYALSNVQLFQLHGHIAENILGQNPRATNYFGSKAVGDFLYGILSKGASTDWRLLLRDSIGEDLSARAMLAYFEPLMDYLSQQNAGRTQTL